MALSVSHYLSAEISATHFYEKGRRRNSDGIGAFSAQMECEVAELKMFKSTRFF